MADKSRAQGACLPAIAIQSCREETIYRIDVEGKHEIQVGHEGRPREGIRMCMLTGARVGEVRTARFEQFNLDYVVWSKPASTTKQRKIHRVPISQEVVAIVRQRQLVVPKGNPWLFPGETFGQPVREIRRFWLKVQKDADLPDLHIHDLRHTFASLLVSGGASLEMIGKLLGHSQMQTTQRYAHLMDSPLRAGVDTVASLLRPRPRLVHDADHDGATLPKSA